jgi:hypothetical protein
MTAERVPSNDTIRAIIQAPIRQLVEVGLEGGEQSALRMLALAYVGKLFLAGDIEGLMEIKKEVDEDLEAATAETSGQH